ncbi:MAG: hypothetical protein CFE44_02650 [Burkholderiales bacterium PBB4]|nr:MAG: hypothetical protein CFE44_02650 [Burkholderiales bacterium PBB4]
MTQSQTAHSSAQHRTNGGYVLLFTLGVLAVVAVLSLSVASAVRIEARSISDEKVRVQQEYAMSGAVHHAMAAIESQLENKGKDSGQSQSTSSKVESSTFASTFDLELHGFEMHSVVTDATLLPDGNLLTLEEWEKVAGVLGGKPDESKEFAALILNERNRIEQQTGRKGFRSLRELTDSNTLPLPLVRGALNDRGLVLADLVVLGTQKKLLDINESPLEMFEILAGFDRPKLERLRALRSRGRLSESEAKQLIGNNAIEIRRETSNFLRLTVKSRAGLGSRSLDTIALIKKDNNQNLLLDTVFIQRPQRAI